MEIKHNKLDTIAEVFCMILLIVTTLYTIYMYIQLPEKIPIHYNAAGVIDRYGNKLEIFILLIVTWVMYIGLSLVTRVPQFWNTGVSVTAENKDRVYRILKNMLKIIKMEIIVIFCYLIYNTTTLYNLPKWFVPVFLVLLFSTMLISFIVLIKKQNNINVFDYRYLEITDVISFNNDKLDIE